VLLWHGDWQRAEEELLAAVEELRALRPGRDVNPLARLAELRRRQGRTSEAEALLARVESHRFHALVNGLLALDHGDDATAMDAAARFLRRVGEMDRFERVAGLDLMVRAVARRARSRPPGSRHTELRSRRPQLEYRHRCDGGRACLASVSSPARPATNHGRRDMPKASKATAADTIALEGLQVGVEHLDGGYSVCFE
jgi:hypothetical protein